MNMKPRPLGRGGVSQNQDAMGITMDAISLCLMMALPQHREKQAKNQHYHDGVTPTVPHHA